MLLGILTYCIPDFGLGSRVYLVLLFFSLSFAFSTSMYFIFVDKALRKQKQTLPLIILLAGDLFGVSKPIFHTDCVTTLAVGSVRPATGDTQLRYQPGIILSFKKSLQRLVIDFEQK